MDGTLKIPSVTGIDVELRIAGPGGRSYAFVIDWHIRVLAGLAWMAVGAFGYFASISTIPSLEANQADFALIVVAPAAAIYFLYHPVLEVLMRGRTPGKRIAGVRIVKRDGGVPGIGPLLVRNLFRLVDSLPFLYLVGLVATLLTSQSVRIGDIAAGTLLVYDDAEAGTFDDAPSSRGIERLGLERAELVRDLLARWPELREDARSVLARRLLEREEPVPKELGADELRVRLERLLH
jgi:uncharacterized RDD family membrane protein YckC